MFPLVIPDVSPVIPDVSPVIPDAPTVIPDIFNRESTIQAFVVMHRLIRISCFRVVTIMTSNVELTQQFAAITWAGQKCRQGFDRSASAIVESSSSASSHSRLPQIRTASRPRV